MGHCLLDGQLINVTDEAKYYRPRAVRHDDEALEHEDLTGMRLQPEILIAASDATQACDLARIGFWKKVPGILERLVPGLVCPPEGEADAKRMLARADQIAELSHLTSAEARDARALRLYAEQIRVASAA